MTLKRNNNGFWFGGGEADDTSIDHYYGMRCPYAGWGLTLTRFDHKKGGYSCGNQGIYVVGSDAGDGSPSDEFPHSEIYGFDGSRRFCQERFF